MIREIRSYRLLEGIRGEPPVDLEALENSLLLISRLVTDFPEIVELDINPLMVFGKGRGAMAIDMRLVLASNHKHKRHRMHPHLSQKQWKGVNKMKALYITSIHRFGGKTAFSLALGRRLKKEGYNVGFFKPVSAQPWEPLPGEVYDDDAHFVKSILEINEPLEKLVGVVLTPSLVMSMRCGCGTRDLMGKVVSRLS